MVRELKRPQQVSDFPETAPAANPVFYRTYSRRRPQGREVWEQVCDRAIRGLTKLGKLTPDETELLYKMMRPLKSLPSGRWLWVGGTEWIEQQKNFSGAYNCTSTNVRDWRAFGLMMDLAMMGCGTGAVLEPRYIEQLPPIRNRLEVKVEGEIGSTPRDQRKEETEVKIDGNTVHIKVGDSRQGWVKSYQTLLELSTDERFSDPVEVIVDLSDIRPAGEPLKGFGGVANPVKLAPLYQRCASLLHKAVGRQLTSVECCILIDEAAVTIVAGNIRRSAGMRQGISSDELFAGAKDNLWQQDAEGNWRIDPERDALRMANHTRVFHRKPTEQECIEATRKQYYSGEGAIQWAGEAIARANCDLLQSPEQRLDFLKAYEQGNAKAWIEEHYADIDAEELEHRLARIGLNPCGEIIGSEFHCNLAEIHLNNLAPHNYEEQEDAFAAGAISVATLLNHEFIEPRYRYSRELDPIVGVSFTGLFDFFVNAFGVDWLRWWQEGRPGTEQGRKFKEQEAEYLTRWQETVHRVTWDYCDRHGLKRPNRCTCVQPSGTKSLLTNASPGWHPPFGLHWIRRITFAKEDPVALACLDYGYSVIPGQSDKDENGNLLNDPFDERVKEWLVEIPTEVPWANLRGVAEIKINDFTALAMFDFYMQVQKHWTTHNTSSTIVFTEEEIEPLGKRIYEAIRDDEGYISSALLAKFDAPFPRLPFERISKEQYEQLQTEVEQRRKSADFAQLVNNRLSESGLPETGPQDAACSGLTCEMKGNEPLSQ
jgi:ribonucleotide reductase class II